MHRIHMILQTSNKLLNRFPFSLAPEIKLCTLKDHILANFKKFIEFLTTLAYSFRSSSVMLVEVSVSSASSPMQYIKYLCAARRIHQKVPMTIDIGQIAFSTTATDLVL